MYVQLGCMSTYRLVVAGSDERLVGVLARFQDNARQVLELIFGIGGIHCASHDCSVSFLFLFQNEKIDESIVNLQFYNTRLLSV